MPPVANADAPVAARLQTALDTRGLSKRAFARLLAGENATHEELEAERSNVNRWLRAKNPTTPNRQNAIRIARALGEPDDAYVTLRAAARRDLLAELREEVVDLQSQLDVSRRAHAGLLRRVVALEKAAGIQPRSPRAAQAKQQGEG